MTKKHEEATAAVNKAYKKFRRLHSRARDTFNARAAYDEWLLTLHTRALAFPKGKPTPFENQANEAYNRDPDFVFDAVIVYSMDEVDRTIPGSNLVEFMGEFIEDMGHVYEE